MPGSLRYASGSLANLLARGQTPTYSSAHANYPGANAIDGDASKPWITAGNSTESITKDLSEDLYGEMESFPTGWTADHEAGGSGAIDLVNANDGAASAALSVTNPGDVARYFRDYTLAAGETRRFVAALGIQSGTGTAKVKVKCLDTGKWLAGAGDWQASESALFSEAGALWQSGDVTAALEDFATTNRDALTIRIIIELTESAGACTANFDSVHTWPAWDVVSLHGQNADPGQAIAVYSGASVASLALAFSFAKPTLGCCYAVAPALVSDRFVRILLPGANLVPWQVGEAALWQSKTPTYGWLELDRSTRPIQVRAETLTARASIARLSKPLRTITLSLQSVDEATYLELAGELWHRTEEGEEAILIIPDDEATEVILGRVTAEPLMDKPKTASTIRNFKITIAEDGLPTVGL